MNQYCNKLKGAQDKVIQEIKYEKHHNKMAWRDTEKVKRCFQDYAMNKDQNKDILASRRNKTALRNSNSFGKSFT